MVVFWWVMGVLFALTAIPCVFYFFLFVSTGEEGCKRRYQAFWRWALLIFMLTFNFSIWRHVLVALWRLWFPASG